MSAVSVRSVVTTWTPGRAGWRSAFTRPSFRFTIRNWGSSSPCSNWQLRRWIALPRQAASLSSGSRASRQAVEEATLASDLGYEFGLVSLAAMRGANIGALIEHCRLVGEVLGVFGFYLQPKVGGVELSYECWRRLCELENVAAIKVAAFDRYQTLTVMRAVAESGRTDIALYTGNDDHIVLDLVIPFETSRSGAPLSSEFVGGLLGQWAVWTSKAVELLPLLLEQRRSGRVTGEILRLAVQLTDANSAIFDAANNFKGCIPGIHEVLCRQGLLA